MPQRRSFDWDQANTDHLARHRVEPAETEQVLANNPLIMETSERKGEVRTVCLGRTDAGRALIVVYTKRGGQIRVVTAYPAKRKKRKNL